MMEDAAVWPKLVVGVLATWRVTNFLAREEGPAGIALRLREALQGTWAGRLFDCFDCLSLAVALAPALWLTRQPLDLWWCWLALSGAACLCDRLAMPPVPMIELSDPSQEDR